MKTIEEVTIVINGVELTNAQRVAVCAAIDMFDGYLDAAHGLAEPIAAGYMKSVNEVQDIIMGPDDAES